MLSEKVHRLSASAAFCIVYAALVLLAGGGALGAAEKGSLWKIRTKNNVVYLMGSIHYLKAQNYPLDPGLEAAFNDAKKIVFEIDLGVAQDGQTEKVMAKAAYPDGTTLKNHVAEATYQLAAEKLNALGLDIGLFNLFKPWFTANIILARTMQALGFDSKHGVDQYFFRKARQEGKEIGSFETLEYQLDLFNKMPDFVQELLLLQTLHGVESTGASLDTIVKAWKAGDLKTLDAELLRSMREYPEVYQRVIVDRNRAWLPRIESYLSANENYLVIVGAGHLAGREGLIEMLKAKGYSVEQ